MSLHKSDGKAKVSKYACPVEGCDVAVYVTYDEKRGDATATDFRCDRQGKCGIPSFDPCPLYVDLIEKRGIRRSRD